MYELKPGTYSNTLNNWSHKETFITTFEESHDTDSF